LGISKFYMKIPEGLIEVTGASIHPSNDPLKNRTKPFGYFFVARIIDAAFIKEFEKVSQSQIILLMNSTKISKANTLFSPRLY
jgi:hypothetical protein